MMGQFGDFELNRAEMEKEELMVRSVARKITMEDFLDHQEKKVTECSRATKKILARVWANTELTPEEQIRVFTVN